MCLTVFSSAQKSSITEEFQSFRQTTAVQAIVLQLPLYNVYVELQIIGCLEPIESNMACYSTTHCGADWFGYHTYYRVCQGVGSVKGILYTVSVRGMPCVAGER